MTDDPVEGLKDMPFHLGKHLIIVERAAHGLQLPDCGHTFLAVTVFGSDQEGSAANELVVALVDNTAGAVAVEEVDSKEQGLWKELEGGVSLNEEVEEVGSHEPLDLGLNVNGVDVWHRLGLCK